MVQLNIPNKFLGPLYNPPPKMTGEAFREKISANLLPNGKCAVLKREPANNPTRLLTTVIYFKLKRKFLNTGTQKECVELFAVNEKQLSKLISGRCYQGGSEWLSQKGQASDNGQGTKKQRKDIPATQSKALDQ